MKLSSLPSAQSAATPSHLNKIGMHSCSPVKHVKSSVGGSVGGSDGGSIGGSVGGLIGCSVKSGISHVIMFVGKFSFKFIKPYLGFCWNQ